MELSIDVKNKESYYKIVIGKGLLNQIPKILKNKPLGNDYAIVTDSNVKELYGNKLLEGLHNEDIEAELFSFKAGEENKTRNVKEEMEDKIIASGFGRDMAIIALGGGVVGDVAGFVAATLYRGVNLIQVPTTLLAQVDSSIGGKAAINHQSGKNLIGTFYNPKIVFADVDALKSMPKSEFANGLVEMIKHALILDKDHFIFLENNIDRITALEEDILISAIKRSCEAKKIAVEKDEKEENFRKILNFGHTIGHSLESASNYNLAHGEAVSIGIMAESEISKELGLLNEKDVSRIKYLLRKANLPIEVPKSIEAEKIIYGTMSDKKTIKKVPYYTLLEGIGKAKINVNVSEDILFRVLNNLAGGINQNSC